MQFALYSNSAAALRTKYVANFRESYNVLVNDRIIGIFAEDGHFYKIINNNLKAKQNWHISKK